MILILLRCEKFLEISMQTACLLGSQLRMRREGPGIFRRVRRHDSLANQVAQGFGGAATERTVARAAVKAVDGILLGESEAAMYLQRIIGHAQSHFVAKDLGNRGHEGIRKRISRRAGAIEDAASRFDVLVHVGDLPAVALEIADCLAENLAVARVFHGFRKRTLGKPKRDAWIETALGVKAGQELAESVLAN